MANSETENSTVNIVEIIVFIVECFGAKIKEIYEL